MKHPIAALLVVAVSVVALAEDPNERLRSFTGRWNMTMKFWMDPAQPPQEFTGTAAGRMVLGGRFLQIEGKTGGAFESESLTMMGFDRRTDDYTLVGYDTLGTYYITAAGKPGNDGVVLHGSYMQPPHGGEQKYRFVWKSSAPDAHTMELFFALPDGKEMKVAETAYRRAK